MVTRTSVSLICDNCGTEDLVDSHMLAVDGHLVETEACDSCWKQVVDATTVFYREGRKVPTGKTTNGKKHRLN